MSAMRKTFNRVKQAASQTLGRGEKTERMTKKMSEFENTVERIRRLFESTCKVLGYHLHSEEKKQKKSSKHYLAESLQDAFKGVPSDSESEPALLKIALEVTTAVMLNLSRTQEDFESQVDIKIRLPIVAILEKGFAEFDHLKKKLNTACLDYDACKTRYQNALKDKSKDSFSKVESTKSELDHLATHVDQCRDRLEIAMFELLAREKEFATFYAQLMQAELMYHRSSLAELELHVPELLEVIDQSVLQPVFGISLEEQHKVFGKEVSFVIEDCVLHLYRLGMRTEGLFRVASTQIKLRKLKACFDVGNRDVDDFAEVHSVTGCLKNYLRTLPEPLMKCSLIPKWLEASKLKDGPEKDRLILSVLQLLPQLHYVNLRYLICFLYQVSLMHEFNKMTPANLAIVIAPNLLWDSDDSLSVQATTAATNVVEYMISNCPRIFEAVDFDLALQSYEPDTLTDVGQASQSSSSLDGFESVTPPVLHLSDIHLDTDKSISLPPPMPPHTTSSSTNIHLSVHQEAQPHHQNQPQPHHVEYDAVTSHQEPCKKPLGARPLPPVMRPSYKPPTAAEAGKT